MKIAVLSDIHGNHYALSEVLRIAKNESVEKLLVLGDITGYYYHPDKVMDMLDDWNHLLIQGNHERFLKKLSSGEIKEPELRKKYGSGHRLALEKLSVARLERLFSAPVQQKVSLLSINLLMCHGSPLDADMYLYPDTPKETLEKCDVPGVDFVLVGHSHYSFSYKNKNSTLLNVGSVGQARSTGGIAFWGLITTEDKSFEIRETPYDIKPLLKEVEKYDPDINYLRKILIRK